MTHRTLLPGLLLAAGLVAAVPASFAGAADRRADAPKASAVTFRLATRETVERPAPRGLRSLAEVSSRGAKTRSAADQGPALQKAATAASPRVRAGFLPRDARDRDEQTFRPRKVFGTDDRFEVPDPAAYPWSSVCKVFAEFPDGSVAEGSAVLVGDRYALTAGHVVYDAAAGGFAEHVEVVPAYDFGDAPFGTYYASDVTSFNGWIRDGDYDWDFALVTLDGDAGNDAGWLGLGAYDDTYLAGLTVNTAGYPGDLDSGEIMYGASGEIERVQPGQLQMRGEMDAAYGQSGSGVWVKRDDGRYVVGVVSTETSTYNQAARVTGTVFDALVSWMDAPGGADFVLTGLASDVPAEFEAPASIRATVTVANDGEVGDTVEVALLSRDVYGRRTVLARRDAHVAALDEVDVAFTASLGTSFPAGTHVLEAEVNGDRGVTETDYDDDRRDGPAFVVLPPYGSAAFRTSTWDVLDPGDVARYRLSVPAGLRKMRLQLSAGRGAYATVTRPDGSRFVLRAGGLGLLARFPADGTWLVDIRVPASAPRARGVRFRTATR